MKKAAILGSTGSIGTQTLDVIRGHPDRFDVVGLSAAGSSPEKLAAQVREFHPGIVAVPSPAAEKELRKHLKGFACRIDSGKGSLDRLAGSAEADVVVSAISGSSGLPPTLAAVKAGKTVLLANKESIVMGGELFMRLARESGARIIPIDSEHNAIFQCIDGKPSSQVLSLTITASGGPFLRTSLKSLSRVTPTKALKHPVWRMGRKISIDSATLMNKALELVETRWLFDVAADRLRVLVHPQSIVHAVVECVDTAAFALMALPDMKVPIAYALAWPDRLPMTLPRLDLARLESLTFFEPDPKRFPSIPLAYEVLRAGNGSQVVMNAANEVAVHAFLDRKIPFPAITRTVSGTLDKVTGSRIENVSDIFEVDRRARETAQGMCHAH
ncbi:MAG: 1-deoxy-D-xylulose-5-phosphate reductoisomerase [Nitrospirae bacterium]|nr:1-deoxy-D-xylulose-5-phosphate reductoisomerase [Nitrospirota bacterium]